MIKVIRIPVGNKSGWEEGEGEVSLIPEEGEEEEAGDEGKPLKSIDASLLLLHSLRQSRQKWVESPPFTKFSTRGRSKGIPEIPQPQHTVHSLGRCEIEIGPHIFPETRLFEIQYDLPPGAPAIPYILTNARVSSAVISALQQVTFVASTSSKAPPPPVPSAVLLAHVKAAAGQDSRLERALSLAAQGTASAEALTILGNFVKSLPQDGPLPPKPSHQLGGQQRSDVAIEFKENQADRWLLPLDCAIIGRQKDVIYLSTALPDTPDGTQHNASRSFVRHPITIRLNRTSVHAWEAVIRRVTTGTLTIQETKESLKEAIEAAPPRAYIPYRLPEGPLYDEIFEATADRFAPKPMVMKENVRPVGRPPERPNKRKAIKPLQSEEPTIIRPRLLDDEPKRKREPPPKENCATCGRLSLLRRQPTGENTWIRVCRPCLAKARRAAALTSENGSPVPVASQPVRAAPPPPPPVISRPAIPRLAMDVMISTMPPSAQTRPPATSSLPAPPQPQPRFQPPPRPSSQSQIQSPSQPLRPTQPGPSTPSYARSTPYSRPAPSYTTPTRPYASGTSSVSQPSHWTSAQRPPPPSYNFYSARPSTQHAGTPSAGTPAPRPRPSLPTTLPRIHPTHTSYYQQRVSYSAAASSPTPNRQSATGYRAPGGQPPPQRPPLTHPSSQSAPAASSARDDGTSEVQK